MKKEESNRNGVINPFSEAFLPTWNLWKEFRWEEHQFKYKGCISEQMALKHLVDLSNGFEEKAIKIVEQSIRRTWQGFFPLKETTHGTATKTINIKQPKPTTDNIETKVRTAFNERYGDRGNDASESYLKVV